MLIPAQRQWGFEHAPLKQTLGTRTRISSLTLTVFRLCGLPERAMHHIDFAMTSMVFVADRPRCPSCGEPMWLVRVIQTGPHLSERRFECSSCEAKDVRVDAD